MPAQSPARYLAPLALAVVLIAFIWVVGSSGNDDGGGSTAPAQATTGASPAKRKTASKPKAPPKTYTVQSGDTLAQIALNTGIKSDRLLILNPDLDPNALQVGQKIKLRP
jgi:LysM repeat protein